MEPSSQNASSSSQTESRRTGGEGAPSSTLALEMLDVAVGSLADSEAVVLEAVDWKVAPGDYWAIAGLQGCGKSDFMATAAGVMPPLRGTFRVFGEEPSVGFEHDHLRIRLRLGLVFDGGRLLNHLTVAENVALPLRYHQNLTLAQAEAPTQALLDFAGLSDCGHRMPGDLRRNFQQRAGLARALALKPEVLLLESPLTGFDPREGAWWLDVLDRLGAGHPIVGGQPMTLAATGDSFRPWRDRARQFAVLKNRRFIAIGNRNALAASGEPLAQELLRSEALAT